VTMTGTNLAGCEGGKGNGGKHCNQGVGNGPENCDPGNSNQGNPNRSNDEVGGTPGDPGPCTPVGSARDSVGLCRSTCPTLCGPFRFVIASGAAAWRPSERLTASGLIIGN
jgi:hypothetical protein